jgi:hypothetical protein
MNTETYGQMDFNLPHDLVPLPSQGLYYKSKKKAIKVGYLTASDENIMTSNIQSNGSNLILTLLRNKIYEPDLKPDELLEGDIEAILIFLRNTAFGPEYTLTLTDPKTGNPFKNNVLLDELNIKKPNVLPDENGLFDIVLPKTNVHVKIKPLNYGEITELDNIINSYPQGRVAPKVTMRLSKIIQEINGQTDKGEIAMFVEHLPIADSKFIRNFISENQPSLDLSKQVIAPSGELVTFNVTFGVDFFRPFF